MINTLVENILEHQKLNDKMKNYLMSREYDKERENKYPRSAQGIDYTPQEHYDFLKDHFNKIDCLGPYEKVLLDVMLNSPQQVNLIWGAIGSGKTASFQFIDLFIAANIKESNNLFHLYIDFNDNWNKDYENDKEMISRIKIDDVFSFIADQFYSYITINIGESEFVDFWKFAAEKAQTIKLSEILKVNDLLGSRTKESINLKKEIIRLFSFDNKITSVVFKFKFWMYLLYCYGEFKNNNVVVIYDNIDILLPKLQSEVVTSFAQYFNKCKQVKLLIPIRLMNVKNIENAFCYNRIIHSGLLPIEVIRKRLHYFILNIENEKRLSNYTKEHKIDTFLRAIELEMLLARDSDIFKFCKSIGGYSVRRLLDISQNLFNELRDNSIIEEEIQRNMILNITALHNDGKIKDVNNIDDIYNDIKKLSVLSLKVKAEKDFKPITSDEILFSNDINERINGIIEKYTNFIKKILKDLNYTDKKRDINYCKLLIKNFRGDTSKETRYIEDVFHFLYKDNLTLVKIRIMHCLFNSINFMKVKELLDSLRLYKYSNYQIFMSINSLLTYDKRLLWMDGNTKIKDYEELYDNYGDYFIGLTRAGELYWTDLMKLPIYVEKMLLHDLNNSSIAERIIDVFYKCKLFFELELKEYDKINKKLSMDSEKEDNGDDAKCADNIKDNNFLTLKIVDNMLFSELEILRAHKQRIASKSSILDAQNAIDPIIKEIKTTFDSFIKESKSRKMDCNIFNRHYDFLRKNELY
jgi:hypothetical protein